MAKRRLDSTGNNTPTGNNQNERLAKQPKVLQLGSPYCDSQPLNPFDRLPDEALFHYMSCLPPIAIGVHAMVCKRWAHMASLPRLWCTFAAGRWDNIPHQEYLKHHPHPLVPLDEGGSIHWREYFMIRDVFDRSKGDGYWNDEGLFETPLGSLIPGSSRKRSLVGSYTNIFLLEMFLVLAKNGHQNQLSELIENWQNYLSARSDFNPNIWRVVLRKTVTLVKCTYPKFTDNLPLVLSLSNLINMENVLKALTAEDTPLLSQLVDLLVSIIREQVQNYANFITPGGFCVQDEPSTGQLAIQALDLLAIGTASVLFPIVTSIAKKFLQSSDCLDIMVGCVVLGITVEGFTEKFDVESLPLVIKCLSHPDIKVIQTGFISIGLISMAWSPEFHEQYHSVLLPHYLNLLDNPSLTPYVCSSLSSFFQEANTIFPTIDKQLIANLLPKLLALVPKESLSISTFATIYLAGSDSGISLSPEIMHQLVKVLFQMIENKTGEELIAIYECLTWCCLYSGKQNFAPYLSQTLQYMLGTDLVGINLTSFFGCWARIFETFGEDMAPHLPQIMPKFIEVFDEDFEISMENMGDFRNLLIQVIQYIPKSIVPYLDTLHQIFYNDWNSEVKALECFITILKTRELNNLPLNLSPTGEGNISILFDCIGEYDNTPEIIYSIKLITELKLFNPLPEHYHTQFQMILLNWLNTNKNMTQRIPHQGTLNDEFRTLISVFEFTLKNIPKAAEKVLETMFSWINEETMSNKDYTALFLSMFDDFMEHYPAETPNFVMDKIRDIIDLMWTSFMSRTGAVAQAAVFGIGWVALKFPVQLEQHLGIGKVIDELLLYSKKDMSKERISSKWIFDNCIGALGRMMKAFPTPQNLQKILPQFLSLLPLTADEDENWPQCEILMQFLSRDDLRETYSHHPNLPAIIQFILSTRNQKCTEALKSKASQLKLNLKLQ